MGRCWLVGTRDERGGKEEREERGKEGGELGRKVSPRRRIVASQVMSRFYISDSAKKFVR